jgi:hypothetical protein
MLGRAALSRGAYGDARRLLLRALRHGPVRDPQFYGYLASALGGRPTHRVASRLARAVGI